MLRAVHAALAAAEGLVADAGCVTGHRRIKTAHARRLAARTGYGSRSRRTSSAGTSTGAGGRGGGGRRGRRERGARKWQRQDNVFIVTVVVVIVFDVIVVVAVIGFDVIVVVAVIGFDVIVVVVVDVVHLGVWVGPPAI